MAHSDLTQPFRPSPGALSGSLLPPMLGYMLASVQPTIFYFTCAYIFPGGEGEWASWSGLLGFMGNGGMPALWRCALTGSELCNRTSVVDTQCFSVRAVM